MKLIYKAYSNNQHGWAGWWEEESSGKVFAWVGVDNLIVYAVDLI